MRLLPKLIVRTVSEHVDLARNFDTVAPLKQYVEKAVQKMNNAVEGDVVFSICKIVDKKMIEVGSREDLSTCNEVYAFTAFKVAYFDEMFHEYEYVPLKPRMRSAPTARLSETFNQRELQFQLEIERERTKQKREEEKTKRLVEMEKTKRLIEMEITERLEM